MHNYTQKVIITLHFHKQKCNLFYMAKQFDTNLIKYVIKTSLNKKSGCKVKCTQKIPKATGKWFLQ